MTNIDRRRFVALPLAAALTARFAGSASAQDYPGGQTITFVVGFAAGGFADSVARIIAEHVGKKLGTTVIVDNRGGAASNIAARAVASADPDGLTVLVSTTSLAINATMFKNIDYKLMDDLTPVAIAVTAPETLSAHPGTAKTLQEFIDHKGSYGSAGVGSGSYFTWYSFFKEQGADVVHVPFEGGAPATQAAIGGQVDGLAATASGNTVANVTSGKLDCLAVAAPKRYEKLPDCPTLEELGYPNHYGSSWVGFWVPAGTPDAVVAALNAAINSISEDAEAAANLTRNGDLAGLDVAQTHDFVASEVETWGKRVMDAGAQVE